MPDTSILVTVGVIVLILAILGLLYLRGLFISFILNVLANPAGRITFGILLCIGGLVFGFKSGFAPYQSLSQASASLLVPHIDTPDDGNVYLHDLNNLNVIYVIHDADFSPPVNASSFQNGAQFTSLIYDSSNTEQIQTQITSNFGTSAPVAESTGYTVEQFALNGSTFTTADYRTNPTGIYQNHWLPGGGIAAAGLLLIVLTLWIPRLNKRRKMAAAAAKASPAGRTWSAPVATSPPPGMPYMPTPQPGGPLPPPMVPTSQPGGFQPTPQPGGPLPPPMVPTPQPGGFQAMPGMPTPRPGGFLPSPNMPAPQQGGFQAIPGMPTQQSGGTWPAPNWPIPTQQPGGTWPAPNWPTPMPGNMPTQPTPPGGVMQPGAVKQGAEYRDGQHWQDWQSGWRPPTQ